MSNNTIKYIRDFWNDTSGGSGIQWTTVVDWDVTAEASRAVGADGVIPGTAAGVDVYARNVANASIFQFTAGAGLEIETGGAFDMNAAGPVTNPYALIFFDDLALNASTVERYLFRVLCEFDPVSPVANVVGYGAMVACDDIFPGEQRYYFMRDWNGIGRLISSRQGAGLAFGYAIENVFAGPAHEPRWVFWQGIRPGPDWRWSVAAVEPPTLASLTKDPGGSVGFFAIAINQRALAGAPVTTRLRHVKIAYLDPGDLAAGW